MAIDTSVVLYQLPTNEIASIPKKNGQLFFETNKGSDGKILFDLNGSRIPVGGGGTLKSVRGTFLADGWSTSAPYIQMITVNGMDENDKPIPILVKENIDSVESQRILEKNFGYIIYYESGENTVKAIARFIKPVVDITIDFKGE